MKRTLSRNQRIKVADGFYLDELLPPKLYQNGVGIEAVDSRVVQILQELRRQLQTPITINNWATGGNREWSCVRTPDSPYYRPKSMHSCILDNGNVMSATRAADCLFGNATAEQVRRHIIDRWFEVYKPLGLTRIESDVSWLHFDVKDAGSDKLVIFKP